MSIWNVDSLKVHSEALLDRVEQRIIGLLAEFEKRFIGLLSELEKRIEDKRVAMEKRLDSMNEFRQSNQDQAARSPTRDEVNSKFDSQQQQINALQTFKDGMQGMASQRDVGVARSRADLALAASVLLGTISIVLRLVGK